MDQKQEDRSRLSFAEQFEYILNETDTGVRRLARLTGIPRRTLENWLYGRTSRPSRVEPILKIARVLHLPASDTDSLLLSAGYPPLAELKEQDKPLPPELLQDWRLAPNILMGQKSAALPVQHNLPGAATPFLGRSDMCDELSALLRRPDSRLVTVAGLGGAGKTRLALETARSQVDWFDHGVYFIPLDNVNSKESLWEAILDGLHIPGDGANPERTLVEDYVRNKQILLLLDNFEHLLPLTGEIYRLLATTQRLKLLVTSRQALDLRAEHLYPIGGLSFEEGQTSPAYELFVQTAQRRTPGFDPTPQEAEDIVALCAHVEGLPLAIELSATWSDILSPAQILDHLTRDLHEVWHSAADRPERQKSLWDLFDYSWQMLPKAEQEAAMRLSILRGSFTPQAAMAIAGCDAAVLKLLIQTSVVGRTSGSRLMLHPLVRQFLAQQAELSGYDAGELEKRFMEVTLTWAAQQTSQLRQTLALANYQTLYNEWQHFERAWGLAVQRRRYDLVESCWDIIVYFETRGTWGQGEAFFAATRRQVPPIERRMQALLDEAEAVFALRLYEVPRSLKLAQRSLRTLDELGVDTRSGETGAYARVVLFTAEYALNQRATTEEINQAFKEVAGAHLSRSADIIAAVTAGVAQCARSDFAGATATFEGVLEVAGPDAYVVPTLQCLLAISLRGEGRESAAREQFTLARDRALEIDVYPAVVTATYELRLLQGDDPSTRQCREALEELALQIGSRRTVGHVAIVNAIQYLNLGLFGRGSQLMRIGVAMVWNQVDTAERKRILSIIAQAYIAFGLIKHAPQVLTLIAPKTAAGTS